jgi:exonuclease VII small subunit
MELSKKAQQALEQNNQYLKDLGDKLGYQIESKPINRHGIKSWEIKVEDISIRAGRPSITYRNTSDNHTRPIDDKLMSQLVNDKNIPAHRFQGVPKDLINGFTESFNRYENAVNLANKLQNELSVKQEQKITKKMKI